MASSNRPLSTLATAIATVGDPEGTRTVTSIVALLVALGLALVMLAIWLHRSTRPDPELLAPLEVMGERKWRRADPVWQRRRLDELRPEGAVPLQPSAAPPDIDEAFDRGPSASGFDDLHGDDDSGADSDAALERSEYDDVADRTLAAAASDGSADDTAPHGLLAPPGVDDERAEVPTPPALQRPAIDELPDGEIDPDALAAAMADLDAELGGGSSADGPATGE